MVGQIRVYGVGSGVWEKIEPRAKTSASRVCGSV